MKKSLKKFPKISRKYVFVLAVFALLAAGIYVYYLSTFAFSATYHNSLIWYRHVGDKTIYIPGHNNSELTVAGITTFGGKCENADNGISTFDGKKLSTDGSMFVALRIGDDSGSDKNDKKLISWIKSKDQAALRKFLDHKKIYIRRQTGKDKKGKPVYKSVIATLDDWGPSASVVTAAKKKNSEVKTVIDVSPSVANALGLGNSDGKCTIKKKKVTETALGQSDGKTVEIGFWY